MNICKKKLAGLLAALIVVALASGTALAATDSLVSVDWLARNLNNPKVVVLDVSEFVRYEASHIPGAVRAFGPWVTQNAKYQASMMPPTADLVKMIRSFGVNRNSFVVIYDEGTNAAQTAKSARALWTMEALGDNNVAILDGGFAAWKDAGKPVSSKPVAQMAGDFTGRLERSKVVDLAQVKRVLGSHRVVLVDNRIPDEDFGFAKENYINRYGHLPHSMLWPAATMTKAGEGFSPSFLRDKKELEEMARGVGIPANKNVEIITYSNYGMDAALGYYVLHNLLGYRNVKVFDGSMLVASENRATPIEKDSWGWIK